MRHPTIYGLSTSDAQIMQVEAKLEIVRNTCKFMSSKMKDSQIFRHPQAPITKSYLQIKSKYTLTLTMSE